MDIKFPDLGISKEFDIKFPDLGISEEFELNITQANDDFIMDYELKQDEIIIENLKQEIIQLEEELKTLPLKSPTPPPPEIIPIEEIKPKYENIICYYINLDRRKDRLEKMEPIIDYLKPYFSCERYQAVDAKKLKMQEYVKKEILPPNPRFEGKPFRRGHLACMLSHLNCWKKFLTTKYKYLLILEDDVVINKKYFKVIFPNIMNNINKIKFDWLYLGRQSLGYRKFYNGKQIEKYFYKPEYYGTGNHSYILSREGAKNIVKYLEKKKRYFTINYQFPSWPMDRWDQHEKFYKKIMRKELRILSIIPENYDKKKNYSHDKPIHSKSIDFLFYARNFQDSDTTRVL